MEREIKTKKASSKTEMKRLDFQSAVFVRLYQILCYFILFQLFTCASGQCKTKQG